MPESFAQFLDKWLKQSTAQGLNNPLVKMPVKRFRPLQPVEFNSIANGGALVVGTMSEPIGRNLYKNYQTRIRERGEHCGFVCSGSVEMVVAGGIGQQQRTALFPVCLKRASLQKSGEQIKVAVGEEEKWKFNPVLEAHLMRQKLCKVRLSRNEPGMSFRINKTSVLKNQSRNVIDNTSFIWNTAGKYLIIKAHIKSVPIFWGH